MRALFEDAARVSLIIGQLDVLDLPLFNDSLQKLAIGDGMA
jgi:hypothetical protein